MSQPATWPTLALGHPSGQLPGNAILYTSQSALTSPWYVGAPGNMTNYVYAFVRDTARWDGVQNLDANLGWEPAAEEAEDGTRPSEWRVLRINPTTWETAQAARLAGTKR